jgi:hypothetical protein
MNKLKIAVIVPLVLFFIAFPIVTKGGRGAGDADPPATQVPVTFLNQGWSREDRQMFYHTTQGTRVLPYAWLLALERKGLLPQPPFLTDETVERYRLIPDPDTANNPDRLPVGFAKEVAPDGEFIGVTCAACHTGQLAFNGAKIRVDGGPAMHNLNGFFREAFAALAETEATVLKFKRFSKKVLGERDGLAERARLRVEVARELKKTFAKVLKGELKHLYPTEDGFGRLDALGRGGNLVLGDALGNDRNLSVANAPVGFPHLWGTPFFDWVQWNGSIQQPMARNIGEALGVNTPVTLRGSPAELFRSSVNVENLHLLENQLQKLQPPPWPEEILGRIDRDKASRGAALYALHCAACHEGEPNPPNEFGKRFLGIKMFHLDVIGTDPTDAVNFNNRMVRTGGLGGLAPVITAAAALQAVSTQVARRKYDELGVPPERRVEMDGFRANRIRAPLAYRARDMDGIWATAPYLHNNSVPSIYQLLLPAAQRDTRFYVGNLEYDPRVLGFKADRFPGGFEFRTAVTGNSNAGHEFRDGQRGRGVIGPLLTEEERWAIVEFLKTK